MQSDSDNFESSLGDSLKQKFGRDAYTYELGNHILIHPLADFFESMRYLKEDLHFIMLLDICGVDNSARASGGERFEAVYHLLNMETHQRLRVKVALNEDDRLPSMVDLWKGADWFERECWDMFGLNFRGKKKERLLTHHEFVGHPLRKDYGVEDNQSLSESSELSFETEKQGEAFKTSNREWVNINPSNPAVQGTLRIKAELESGVVKRSKVEIGYLHRCFEKICEGSLYNQVIPYTDRLNYCSAAMNNIGWCKAIEDMMGIDIPDRAKALRMVIAELSRVIDHLMCIGSMAVDLGAMTNFWHCLEQREHVYELFEKLCGARVTVSLTRIGGLTYDIPKGWAADCLDVVKTISKNVEDIDKMLTRSRFWMERTRVCPVSAYEAIEWGYTGPCLRASGVNYDIRKVSPYYFYDEVDFEVPLGINGDCYDRYLVRMEEIRQSLRIVTQVLDNLPIGDIKNHSRNISLPDKDLLHNNIDSLMNHFSLITKGVRPKASEYYSSTEAANGELGFYIISDGSPNPYRVKVRPPCFPIFQSFPEITKNYFLSDAIVTLGSMNVVTGELDR